MTQVLRVIILASIVLFLSVQGFNSAFASPVFSAQSISDPGTVNVPPDGRPDGKMYLDITKVIYSSDGNFLHVTFILGDTFDNISFEPVSYGMLIDTDDNFNTGVGGYDYRYKVTWQNNVWVETYEQLIDNDIEPNIVYSGEVQGLFTHGEKFINLSLDLSKIKSPNYYNIIFFSDGKNFDESPIEDFTSLAIIPPPNFSVTTVPNPIILKAGTHTVSLIQIHSDMQGRPEIFYNVNLSPDDDINVKTLLSENSIFLSDGVSQIPIDVKIPDNITPSWHKISVVLTPFYPVNPNKDNPDIQDKLIRNAYYRNQIVSEKFETGIAVSSADPLPMEFYVQIALVGATIGIVVSTIWSTRKTNEHTRKQLHLAEESNKNVARQLELTRDANQHTASQLSLAREEFSLKKKEIESRLKAELILEDPFTDLHQENQGEGKMIYTGIFEAKLHNIGTVTAENIRVYHSEPQKSNNLNEIVGDEHNIKQKMIRIRGNILQNGVTQIPKIEISLKTRDPFILAIWIIYDDSEMRDRELIYVFNIKGTRNYELLGPYSKSQIEQSRTNNIQK